MTNQDVIISIAALILVSGLSLVATAAVAYYQYRRGR